VSAALALSPAVPAMTAAVESQINTGLMNASETVLGDPVKAHPALGCD
jgi:hypothetical protein